ncbi:probable E3 SUMO-protein ligase RNF212 [Tiliqua scincoides]|uniref:probable E3 SUMO-protein ligase RNF212 n=1 Tax=Tiliqua scincoides TaxID=71010 RepID=UPI0034630464
MAALVFCNACFQRPQRAAPLNFSLTNCGHVLCERCLQKGKKDECMVCRAPCRTVVLSKKMNSDIQSLFMGIDGLCRKYSKEVTQIAQFQEKNRKRLLAYYKGKIAKLEGYLKKATQQMQHIQQLQHKVPSMEVDRVSVRKTETVAGPTRLSLLSPPRNGHMGSVSHRSSQLSGMTPCQNSTSGSVRPSPLRMPNTRTSYVSPLGSSQSSSICLSDSSGLRTTQHFQYTPQHLHSSAIREPISLASLLQRQHLATVASNERSFSVLKEIKPYFWSAMVQERLNGLAVLNINSDKAKLLDFADVIHAFFPQKSM